MNYLGIEYTVKHPPKLDPGFIPLGVWSAAYSKNATVPTAIAVERNGGNISVHHTRIYGTAKMREKLKNIVENKLSLKTARTKSICLLAISLLNSLPLPKVL